MPSSRILTIALWALGAAVAAGVSALTIMVVLGPLVVQWGLAHAGETAPARLNDARPEARPDAEGDA